MNLDIVNHIKLFIEQIDKEIIIYYQLVINSLIWTVTITWSDLVYSMLILSYYLDNSNKEYLALLKTVFKYISETLNIKLTFINNAVNNLIEYTNVNFVRAIDDYKSTNNYMFMLVREYVSHQTKSQIVMTLLLYKLEYMIMFEVDKEIMWIK